MQLTQKPTNHYKPKTAWIANFHNISCHIILKKNNSLLRMNFITSTIQIALYNMCLHYCVTHLVIIICDIRRKRQQCQINFRTIVLSEICKYWTLQRVAAQINTSQTQLKSKLNMLYTHIDCVWRIIVSSKQMITR